MHEPNVRRDGFLWLAVLALALVLRLPWLDAVPNPNGDEGNWFAYALDLSAGREVALPATARFVSTLFARMIAASFRVFGQSFFAARLVPTVGLVAALVALRFLTLAINAPRFGLALAALAAVHPWSVLWSRTVTVPYALSFGLCLCAPLATITALRDGGYPRWVTAGLLHAIGLHFSPLAAASIVATGAYFVSRRQRARWSASARPALVAAACALLVSAPILRSAYGVAEDGASRQVTFFDNLGPRVAVFLRTTMGSPLGEPTVRHFTGRHFSAPGEAFAALAGLALVVFSLSRPKTPAPSSRDVSTPRDELATLTRWHLVVALCLLPLLLAPVRPWNLPAIDSERYLWVLLAPVCTAVATLTETPRWRWLPWLLAAYLLSVPTARCAWFFSRRGGPDLGFYTLAHGGGARGWKVSEDREVLPLAIVDAVDADRRLRPATLVMADYAWNPLYAFASRRPGLRVVDLSKYPLTLSPGDRHYFLLWSAGLLSPDHFPPEPTRENRHLGETMRSPYYMSATLLRRFVQAGGTPLCEVWSTERR